MLAYYSLTFIENSFIAVAWFHFRHGRSLMSDLAGATSNDSKYNPVSSQVALALVLTVVLSFIVGMFFFVIYYLFLHPKAPVKLCQSDDVKMNETEKVKTSVVLASKVLTSTDGLYTEGKNLQVFTAQSPRPGVQLTAIRRLYIPQARNNSPKSKTLTFV